MNCEITPALLRNSGYKESHFPHTTFRNTVSTDNSEYLITLSLNTQDYKSFAISIQEYPKNNQGLRNNCFIHCVLTVEKVNAILELLVGGGYLKTTSD